MKLLGVPSNKEQLNSLLNSSIDGIVLGLKDLSIYFNYSYTIDEIKEIINNTNKEVFLSMNKIMHNNDLDNARKILKEIESLNIKGLFISDIGVFNIIKNEYPAINIVMNQAHLLTNYKTCNYWLNKGVKYAKLSVELMLDEINEIRENTNILLIANVFGYIPMFNSKRKLLTNYFNYINIEKESDTYYIYDEKKDTKYLINEQEQTVIFSDNIMNAVREINKLNIDYGIINGYGIYNESFIEVINEFINPSDNSYFKLNDKIKNMDTGFLYKESIYKVREHE